MGEQRLRIMSCLNPGKYAASALQMTQKAYANGALYRSRLYRWFALCREDDARSGRPSTARTDQEIKAGFFYQLTTMASPPRMTAEGCNIRKNTVLTVGWLGG
jgi:hypothetical protein